MSGCVKCLDATEETPPATTSDQATAKMLVPGGVYQQQGPSSFDQMKMGFFLGFCVDMASGALSGGFSALRTGLRGRELVNTVGKVMMQGGGSFDTFLAIGLVLRC